MMRTMLTKPHLDIIAIARGDVYLGRQQSQLHALRRRFHAEQVGHEVEAGCALHHSSGQA